MHDNKIKFQLSDQVMVMEEQDYEYILEHLKQVRS